jgi:hypothetical protein
VSDKGRFVGIVSPALSQNVDMTSLLIKIKMKITTGIFTMQLILTSIGIFSFNTMNTLAFVDVDYSRNFGI